MIQNYDFDVNNAAIYYLFDRDPKSNINMELITNLIHTLTNAFENENYTRGGMLILSYPSIEAYEVSNFENKSYKLCMKLGAQVKEYINDNVRRISMNKINEDSIVHAGLELKGYMDEAGIDLDLDNFSNMNEKIFQNEETHLMKNDTFRLLSMMSCALMDLGILRESV